MKKPLLLVLVLLLGVAQPAQADKTEIYTEIDAFALKEMMEARDVTVIDSRGGKYFDGVLIQGAKHLSAKETNEQTLAEIAPDKSVPLVFYCTNTECPASTISAYKADKAGYGAIYKFPGGIEEWVGQDFPTETVSVQ